jgi:hypothetical protein
MDSTGNERANILAKEALEFSSSPEDHIPTFLRQRLPTSISAIKQLIAMNVKNQWKKWWKGSPRYKKMKCIDLSLPSDKYLNITSSLNHRQTALLMQLCTGHAPINRHLHMIHKNNMPNCPQNTCRNTIEDIHHLIFTCPRYMQAQYHLRGKIGRKVFNLAKLLTNNKIIPHTFTYLNKIGRFRHIYRDILTE